MNFSFKTFLFVTYLLMVSTSTLQARNMTVLVDSTKIFTYQEFLQNLDGTLNAPDPRTDFTDVFPFCNSINSYPSPFVPTEFSALPFTTFCSNNVVNNITNRGTDVSYQVVVGGNFNAPPTGGASLEGRLAVGGDLIVNKAPAPFRVGESISGTAVVSEPGDFLLVGGNSSGAGRINTGASAFGTYNALIKGTNSLTINGAFVNTNTVLSFDIDTLLAQSKSMSELMSALPATGSFSSGFVGSNDSLEVFNVSADDIDGVGVLNFSNIAPFSTVIINVSGTTVNYQKSVYNGRVNDPLANSNSSDTDATVYNVVWNFYEATKLNVISSPAEGIQGLVLAPFADVDFRTNLNGRLIAGGNVDLNGSGIEFHNYPFKGDLSKIIATQEIRKCVLAVKDVSITPISTPIDLNILANDTLEELTTTSVSILLNPLNGTVTVNPDRTITYNPNPGFQGLDSLQYELCDTADTQVNCDDAFVVVLVGLEAVDDEVVSTPGVQTEFQPLSNDLINPEKTSIDTLIGPTKGSLTINPDGTTSYTADLGFSGRDTVLFIVCDTSTSANICDTSITVIGIVSVIPDAIDDNNATEIGKPININLLANDVFGSLDFLSVRLVTNTNHGTLAVQPDLSFVYTPDAGYTGLDSFNYEICDTTILPGICDVATVIIAIEPEAVTDSLVTTTTTPVSFSPLLNDTINPQVTTVDTLEGPKNGTVNFITETEWEYIAADDFEGLDTFTYIICDTSEVISLCDTALVLVQVNAKAPEANDDICVTEINTSLNIQVLLNDALVKPLKTEVVSVETVTANGGSASLGVNGTVDFVPPVGYRGLDTTTYILCDTSEATPLCDSAEIIIMVGPLAVDDSLITGPGIMVSSLVLLNDIVYPPSTSIATLPSSLNGTVSINSTLKQISYLPENDFAGVDTVNVLVCDTSKFPAVCDTSLLIIKTLSPPPVITDDLVEGFKNQVITVSFLENDIIPNPESTKLTFLGNPMIGTVVSSTDSSLNYLPPLDFLGRDSIQYVLCDTLLEPFNCDSGWVVLSVIDKPAPVAVDDVRATELNTGVVIAVLGNDILPDRPHTIVKNVRPFSATRGTFSVDLNNQVNYLPEPNFRGMDTLVYTICDTIAEPDLIDSALIIITVAPDAVDDTVCIKVGEDVIINVLENDTINVPYTLVDVLSTGTNGTIVNSSKGIVSFIPNDDFVGLDTTLISVCDTSSIPPVCDTSSLIIKVLPTDFLAIDDEYFVLLNSNLTVKTITNDLISPESNLTLSINKFPNNGTVVLNNDLTLTYTPGLDFGGEDTLSYLVCDTVLQPNLCDSAIVVFNVVKAPTSINDTLTLLEDSMDSINVLLNDVDLTDQTVKLVNVLLQDTVVNGTVSFDSTGLVKFVPNENFFGTITYNYISQLGTNADTATLTIVVLPVNDTPFKLIEPEFLTIINSGNTGKSPNVLLNNLDIENDDLFVKSIIKSQADFIGFTISDSTISYLPMSNFIGTDSVLYEVCDRGLPEECMIDTLIVTVLPLGEKDLFIPEAFSPNNDGINDVFEIVGLENYEQNSIKVFNRWGNTVFQENGYQNNWDGVNNVSLSGRNLPSAGYLYVLELTSSSGEELVIKGSVYINR